MIGCSNDAPPQKDVLEISCDAEKVVKDSLVGSNDTRLTGDFLRSKEMARSGNYSLKLSSQNPYGFTYVLYKIKKGQIIELRAWKNKNAKGGALVVSPAGHENGRMEVGHVRETKGDWGMMRLMFVAERDYDSVGILAYNLTDEPVFIDDFNLKVYYNTKKPKIEKNSTTLRLDIPQSALDSLNDFRELALERGVITDDLKDYVKAYVWQKGVKMPVELRLKGDWTDHLETDKISYRIKMCDGYAYNGLRTFSIQNPSTRSYLMEWFAHQMYENEGILTTRYDMIPVVINGKNKGVYALEEHFDKQILEARNRREGPIVKFDESGVWQMHQAAIDDPNYVPAPVFESAEITVFKKNRTKKNPTLFAQFNEAQSKMEAYRNRDGDVPSYFELDKIAKYLALTEIINGKHGLIWHNERYYFNPVKQRLEPIAYDCFVDVNLMVKKQELLGLLPPSSSEYLMTRSTLQNEEVKKRYVYYLERFSDEKYLQKTYKILESKIAEVEKLIQYEYPNIHLDKSYFEFNRASIQQQLVKLKKTKVELNPAPLNYPEMAENFIYTDIALKANVEAYNADSSVQMSFRNYHGHPIEIIGYSTKANKKLILPVKSIRLGAFKKNTVVFADFPVKPRRIHYRAANCGDRIFSCNPEEWGRPVQKPSFGSHVVRQTVNAKNEVRLSGKVIINKSWIIPKCKQLVIEAGTEIVLGKGVFVLTYAPVKALGTKEKPIRMHAPDGNSQGFVCLSGRKSTLSHVTFDGMGTINENNWHLTGAVTFYGAEVHLSHCTFKNNHCEDGLNTIRCAVYMDNCTVDNTYADGFDGDFCTGRIRNSTFSNTGNDCIDFSGSRLTITNCSIINSGDKGISGGENSRLTVQNCRINGAEIAVASKDKSVVTISNLSILKAKYAFAAYRKKPEYDAARLIVKSMKTNKAKQLYLLEKGSRLDYLGKTYVGTKVLDIEAMYARYR